MNSIRKICKEKLTKPAQDIAKSNQMWNKRAGEMHLLSIKGHYDGYMEFFKQHAAFCSFSDIIYMKHLGALVCISGECRFQDIDVQFEFCSVLRIVLSEDCYG